jgi:hypothetical protein
MINPAKLEAIKVWYSVFTVLMDAHADREYTDAELLKKLQELRAKLKELVSEAEPAKPC